MKEIKILFVIALALLPSWGFSHGDEDHGPVDPIPPEQTIDEEFFEDVIYPLIQANCISCHNNHLASGGHSFEPPLDVKSHAELIFDAVDKQRMPLGQPEWRDTLEAKTLLYWALKENSEDHEN